MKKLFGKRNIIISVAVITLLLVSSFAGWNIHQFLTQSNPYEELFAKLEYSQVESISIVFKHPVREVELSDNEQSELIVLLNQVNLGSVASQAYNESVGGLPLYYAFHIKLNDGMDFIFQTGRQYFIIWPDAEAYYYDSPPKRLKGPEAYPMNVFSDSAYQEILNLGESLSTQYFPE